MAVGLSDDKNQHNRSGPEGSSRGWGLGVRIRFSAIVKFSEQHKVNNGVFSTGSKMAAENLF